MVVFVIKSAYIQFNNEHGDNINLLQFQYGAIDTNIIDKLRNEGDLRMRLQVYRPY